jgi:hypothetical protein
MLKYLPARFCAYYTSLTFKSFQLIPISERKIENNIYRKQLSGDWRRTASGNCACYINLE